VKILRRRHFASADRQKPAREDVKALEMTQHAFRETIARHPIQGFGVPDRVVDRWRPKRPGVSQKSLRITRRHIIVAPANGRHPAIALEWQHQAPTAVLGRLAEGHNAFPIGGGIVGDGKDACGIAEIDANCGLLGQWLTARLPQSKTATRPAATISLAPLAFS